MCLTDRAGAILRQHTRSSSQGHHSQGALSAEGNGGGGEGQDEPGSAPYLFSRDVREVCEAFRRQSHQRNFKKQRSEKKKEPPNANSSETKSRQLL